VPKETRYVARSATVRYALRRLFSADVATMPSAQYVWTSSNATVATGVCWCMCVCMISLTLCAVDRSGDVHALEMGHCVISVADARMPGMCSVCIRVRVW
jgi:hypothetical protein